MHFIRKQFINTNGQVYSVIRVFKEENVKNVDLAKELLGCESVFRKEGLLYFCVLVPELEIEHEQQEDKPQERLHSS